MLLYLIELAVFAVLTPVLGLCLGGQLPDTARGLKLALTGPAELRGPDPDKLDAHVTVIDVMHSMGVIPHDQLTWRVGALVRDKYQSRFDRRPVKALRQKTSGKGSHDIAIYPPEMIDDIKFLIEYALEEQKEKAEIHDEN